MNFYMNRENHKCTTFAKGFLRNQFKYYASAVIGISQAKRFDV